ncbi:E3 ubiquitin-protein ligase RNF13 isoform X2 [Schistocerca nitens]|uniref:E3 ubiquitin-protein ligase RNF13 isoform X2 n=1 Tax=Schistocerca nitens TaxID=7011 RepID=UPI002118CABF|nr:E3 ubiquitin-protein ligase RNF13 isoform X2 [Schistocerca nitens]
MRLFIFPLVVALIIALNSTYADVIVYSVDLPPPIAEFRDLPARFGDGIPSDGLKGMLVLANPLNACSPIEPPPQDSDGDLLAVWMVLIKRGDCTFESKVRNAQNANYSAAIVHNVNSSILETMTANHPQGIHIPSIFVSDATGTSLKNRYLFKYGYYIVITDDIPFNISATLLLPFAIIVGLCFLIMLIIMVVRCIRNRRRERRHRLPASSLRKIPTAKFQKGDPYETCAICLEDYIEGDKLRILPCSHAYHSKCIDPWLTRNRRVCPVCKRRVFAHDEHLSETESDTDTDDTTPLLRQPSHVTQGGTFTPASSDVGGSSITGGSTNRVEQNDSAADLSRSAPAASLPRGIARHIGRRRRLFHSVQPEVAHQRLQPQQDSESVTSESSSASTETSSDYWDSLYASAEAPDEAQQQGPTAVPTVSGEHSINGDGQVHSPASGNSRTHDVVV